MFQSSSDSYDLYASHSKTFLTTRFCDQLFIIFVAKTASRSTICNFCKNRLIEMAPEGKKLASPAEKFLKKETFFRDGSVSDFYSIAQDSTLRNKRESEHR